MDNPLDLLKQFASSFEVVLGTEDTTKMITALTKFAVENPATVTEIQVLVQQNPETFASLLTPQGIQEAKQMIELVSGDDNILNMFGS